MGSPGGRFPFPGPPPTTWITEVPMGSIITATAVLLTHMLRKAAARMNPPTSFRGDVPTAAMIPKAIRR
jgi:hypothetical protein